MTRRDLPEANATAGLESSAVEALTRATSRLIADAALDPGDALHELTLRLSTFLCVALAYEPDDLKRAERLASIESLIPEQIQAARPHALRYEAEASGGFIQ